jgi:outer membrane lipoprotein-sorting protein
MTGMTGMTMTIMSATSVAVRASTLEDFSKRMSAMKGFSMNFECVVQTPASIETQENGSLLVSGTKYRLEMNNMLVVFDGTARYTYLKTENEILIETPNPLRDGIFADPSTIFAVNPNVFHIKQTEANATLNLNLTPKQSGLPYEKITMGLAKKTLHPVKFVYYGSDGRTTALTISNFKANIKPAAEEFIFNRKQYPQAEVVDMR